MKITEIAPDIAFADYDGERVHFSELEDLVRFPVSFLILLPFLECYVFIFICLIPLFLSFCTNIKLIDRKRLLKVALRPCSRELGEAKRSR